MFGDAISIGPTVRLFYLKVVLKASFTLGELPVVTATCG